MRVTLIFCPIKGDVPYPPISLAYLSATLKSHRHETDVLDLNGALYASHPQLCREIAHFFATPVLFPEQKTGAGAEEESSDYSAMNNIDTIYNLNLLLFALGLEPLTAPSPHETVFIERLKNQIAYDAQRILEKNPEVAGFSTYISNVAYTCILAQTLKKLNPRLRIIFGGSATGYAPNREFFIKTGLADALVVGEGETALIRLLGDMSSATSLRETYGPMTAYDEAGDHSPDAVLVKDLDTLPFPDFDGFDFSIYSYAGIMEEKDGVILPIAASRGCVGRCKYCSETKYWKHFRQRSVNHVIEEIKTQIKKYNAKYFFFQDSLINGNQKWLEKFCNTLIAENLGINWTSYSRITGVNPDVLPLMKAAGCHMLVYGVEHTSVEIIKKSEKDMKRERVLEVLLHTASAGIIPAANFIYGFPFESDADFMDMLCFVHQDAIRDNVICTFRPFELRVNSDLFIHRDQYPIEIGRKHTAIPESLAFIASAIDGVNIYWKCTTPGYYRRLDTWKNLFWGITDYQKSRWGDYRKWVRNFHFPTILWSRISGASVPILAEYPGGQSAPGSNRVIVSPVPLDALALKLLTWIDNQSHLEQYARRMISESNSGSAENNDNPSATDHATYQRALNEVKAKLIELTLKGRIRWGKTVTAV